MNTKSNLIKILKGQYITEKTTKIAEKNKSITFLVDINSNKTEIKNIVEEIFKVKIKSVKTINVKGKKVKFKAINGKKKNWKKAIVILKKDYDINFSEMKI